MQLGMYTVFDTKAGAYLRPFFARTNAEAIRMFSDTVSDANSLIAKHPEDFSLFKVGEYDEVTGVVSGVTHANLVSGVVAKAMSERNA